MTKRIEDRNRNCEVKWKGESIETYWYTQSKMNRDLSPY